MSEASPSFSISFSLGCHLPAGVTLRHCVLWMVDDVMVMLEWKIKQISWNILSYHHLNEKKDTLWRGRVPFQCITLNIDSVQYPHVDPGSNLNLIVFVIGIPNANSQHFNLRTLLHPTPTPIQQAALFKRQNMSQTVQVGSCHGYQLSCCITTLRGMYNLSPKPVKKNWKKSASQRNISQTCDTIWRYQGPSHARTEQREFPQNGQTAAVKCPIHKSFGWMLCWSLVGPLFQWSNPTLCSWNCWLKVESNK